MCELVLLQHVDPVRREWSAIRREWSACIPTEAERAGRVTLTEYLEGLAPEEERLFRETWLETPLAKPLRRETDEERLRRVADEERRQRERGARKRPR